MKVLFIGGTGIISSACSKLAVSKGIDLYHLNRGKSRNTRSVEGVKTLISDIRDINKTQKAIQGYHFDVVVDWIAFEPEHIESDILLFAENRSIHFYQFSIRIPNTTGKVACNGGDNSGESILGIFKKENSLRESFTSGISEEWIPIYYCSSVTYL
jgi:hypothetical protein